MGQPCTVDGAPCPYQACKLLGYCKVPVNLVTTDRWFELRFAVSVPEELLSYPVDKKKLQEALEKSFSREAKSYAERLYEALEAKHGKSH